MGACSVAALGIFPLSIYRVRFVSGLLLLVGATVEGFEYVPSPWRLLADFCLLNAVFCLLACMKGKRIRRVAATKIFLWNLHLTA